MESVEAFSNSDRSGTSGFLYLPTYFFSSTMCFNPLYESEQTIGNSLGGSSKASLETIGLTLLILLEEVREDRELASVACSASNRF